MFVQGAVCTVQYYFILCRRIGSLMEESLAVLLLDLMKLIRITNPVASRAVCKQLLEAFPVMAVSNESSVVLINSHELLLSGDAFDELLSLDKANERSVARPRVSVQQVSRSPSTSSTVGRPSIVSKFPGIVKAATDFIKANGFSAHERRREETGKIGVSIAEIREHLLSNVPGLREHGISSSAVSRLLEPPHRGTIASTRYKGLVSARVPGKRNQYREFHQDQHYLFAQVAYRREMTEMFSKECAILSADDMNKIKVGALAVSRYHQIQRVFLTDESPNVPDHDFPVPGYLIIPSGYMRLINRSSLDSSIIDGEDMTQYRDHGLNDVCQVSLDTSAQVLANPMERCTLPSPIISSPASTKVTATLSDTVISIQVHTSSPEQTPTSLTVEVSTESAQHTVSVSTRSAKVTPSLTIKDSLGRPHFRVPHTGPASICLRSAIFHSSTSEMHTHDLKPIVEAIVQEGRTVITIIADSGPDWNTASLLNSIYYMRLWKSSNLDMLSITSFAARYSAYNPIEHLWSPLSKRLASVRLSPVADGDTKAPFFLAGLTSDQKMAKEAEVFDKAIGDISDVHWNNFFFDSSPVVPVPIKCESGILDSDHNKVAKFLKAPLRDIRSTNQYSGLLEEYKFMLKHCSRHHNEIIFLKCTDKMCDHCFNNPVRATETASFLRDRGMQMFYPAPSAQHPGHYCTFLEMCNKDKNDLPLPDSNLPTFNKDLGRCPHCPDYVFLSKTEKKRHNQVFHPQKRSSKLKPSGVPNARFKCRYKISETEVCGQMFPNIYHLSKHRKSAGHQRKYSNMTKAPLSVDVCRFMARVQVAQEDMESMMSRPEKEPETGEDMPETGYGESSVEPEGAAEMVTFYFRPMYTCASGCTYHILYM